MVLEDNDVDHFALWKRTYQPGIFWSGVNNTSAGVDSKQRQPCLATLPGGPLGGGCGCMVQRGTEGSVLSEASQLLE